MFILIILKFIYEIKNCSHTLGDSLQTHHEKLPKTLHIVDAIEDVLRSISFIYIYIYRQSIFNGLNQHDDLINLYYISSSPEVGKNEKEIMQIGLFGLISPD